MLNRWIKIRHLFAVGAVLACAACGGAATQWTKPGASAKQLEQDLEACNQTAAQFGAAPYFDPRRGQIISGSQDASQARAACMMGRGWTLVP